MSKDSQRSIYCSGIFCFDCRDDGFEEKAACDYRAVLLGGVEAMLKIPENSVVRINGNVTYVGPFYFETKDMQPVEIVKCEMEMIEACTDAIFLLDTAACPGTIAEVMYANSLQKRLHLFYIRHNDDAETESDLHTPCWYPLHFCLMTNRNAELRPCVDVGDAVEKICRFVSSLGGE